MRHSITLLFLVGSVAVSHLPAAAQVTAVPIDTVESYVVKPGDTLEGITEHYLGEPSLWPDNWKLNSQVRNPHLLQPGQVLRIITHRQLPPRTAQVTTVEKRVEKKPPPNPWIDAEQGDLLEEEYGLRTGRRSSARLLFDDGTALAVTEESLIFLRQVGTSLRGVRKEAVEIIEGQADLTAAPVTGPRVEVEIILGNASARPQPGVNEAAETRARLAESGDAKLMVFSGTSDVAAGGRTVVVPKGMGTSVPEEGAPSKPERLLKAPRAIEPAAGSSWSYADPIFRWEPVRGSDSYTIDVCWDAQCARLAERATGVGTTDWRPARLPKGDLYWKVNAVSGTGLDGYPTEARSLSILSDRADTGPPVVVAIPVGSAHHIKDDWIAVGPDASIRLEAMDDAAGVKEIRYRWSGSPWAEWTGIPIPIPMEEGQDRLEFQAVDRLGNESEIYRIGINRRRDALQPPTVLASPGVFLPVD